MKEELDPRFKIVCRLLMLAGIPLAEKLTLKYKIYRAFSLTMLYLMSLTTLMHTVKNREDVQAASDSLRISFTMFESVWMMVFVSFESKRVEKMLILSKEFTWEDLPTRYPDTGSRTNATMISLAQTATIRFMIVTGTLQGFALIVRRLSGTKYPLFFNAWLPLDLEELPGYTTMLIIQIVGSASGYFGYFGVIVLYVVFVSLICSQLEKATMILEEMKWRENKDYSALLEKLRVFVIIHQKSIRFKEELEKLLTMTFFGPILSLVAALCFNIFNAVKQPGSMADLIQIITITALTLSQLYVICAFGNELSKQSERLRDAIWECDWVGTPLSFQKSLLLMLTATKEFTLTTGKIIPLSRHTMLQVLNNTYSFLMILLSSTDNTSDT